MKNKQDLFRLAFYENWYTSSYDVNEEYVKIIFDRYNKIMKIYTKDLLKVIANNKQPISILRFDNPKLYQIIIREFYEDQS